jgi:Isochorismatase family
VKKTGRKKIVIAALWTEICFAMPAIQARGEGYDVFVVTDASGGSLSKLMTWQFDAWFKRTSFQSLGWPFFRNGSAIGRVPKGWERSRRYLCSTVVLRGLRMRGKCSFSRAVASALAAKPLANVALAPFVL